MRQPQSRLAEWRSSGRFYSGAPGRNLHHSLRPFRFFFESPVFNEILAITGNDVSVLASYASDYYAGRPAATLHRKGQGRVIHFGSFFTPESVTSLLDVLGIVDPFAGWARIPAAVQTVGRSNGSERFCFLLNFTPEPQAVMLTETAFDLFEEQELVGHAEIPPYGVRFIGY